MQGAAHYTRSMSTAVAVKILCRISSVICYLTSDSDSHVVARPRVRRNKSERNARRTAADLSAHDPSGVHAQTHTRARDVKLPQRKQEAAAERSGLIC